MATDLNTSSNDTSLRPQVILSFDFEMRWGVHDVFGMDFEAYKEQLDHCRPVVEEMLGQLVARNLKATWATVGALGMDNWDDYFLHAPPPPAYSNPELAVKKEYAELDPEGKWHFAPDLIRKIVSSNGQELGSHSFSHLQFLEPGVKEEDFLSDMRTQEQEMSKRFGVVPVSLVFPRNQCAFRHLLDQTSIRIWRGTEPRWFYDCTSRRANTLFPRALRLADSVNPWVRRASHPEQGMVRASLFVRFGLSDALWKLQLMRIEKELSQLKSGEVFHCWWHPHNLGGDWKQCQKRLTQVLDLIAEACEAGRVDSISMRDRIDQTQVPLN